jgi:predicted nucleic acid-binding protein
LRLLLRNRIASDAGQALEILRAFQAHPAHVFWPDAHGYEAVRWHGVLGQAQITDAYLASLARKHRGRLATFDKGMAALHDDVAVVVPVLR